MEEKSVYTHYDNLKVKRNAPVKPIRAERTLTIRYRIVLLALAFVAVTAWLNKDLDLIGQQSAGNTEYVPGRGYGPSTQSPELLDKDRIEDLHDQNIADMKAKKGVEPPKKKTDPNGQP